MNAHSLPERMQASGQQAKTASAAMAKASAAQKSAALRHLAQRLRQEAPALIEANRQDVERAQAAGLEGPMLDRLKLLLSPGGKIRRSHSSLPKPCFKTPASKT